VSQRLHDHTRADALGQQQGRARMPEIVEANRWEAVARQEYAKFPGDTSRLKRRTDAKREDEPPSRHLAAAAMRFSSCRTRCGRRAVTATVGRAIVRRLRADFGSTTCSAVLIALLGGPAVQETVGDAASAACSAW
jgi:hypothetical protein